MSRRHGTSTCYVNDRCRCVECRRANARYEAGRRLDELVGRPRRVPAIGTHRRLQALVAIGWPQYWLAERLGLHRSWVAAKLAHQWVTPAVHARVCRLYNDLWDTPPTPKTAAERNAVQRARTYAARHGWTPPLSWDDDTIDNPHARPQGVPGKRRTSGAAVENVLWLAECGTPAEEIARRVGVSASYVETLLRGAAA